MSESDEGVADIRFVNPLADGGDGSPVAGGDSSPSGSSAYVEGSENLEQAHVAQFESHLSVDDISDLKYAFQACDSDRSGTIDVSELDAMLDVLGATTTPEVVRELFRLGKNDFGEWRKQHDSVVLHQLPEQMQYQDNDVGHLDNTKHGGERHYHDMVIDRAGRAVMPQFQAVRDATNAIVDASMDIKVVSTIAKPISAVGKPLVGVGMKAADVGMTASTKALSTAVRTTKVGAELLVQGAARPLNYTGQLLDVSYGLMVADKDSSSESMLHGERLKAERQALNDAIANPETMIFAEFVHLWGGARIQELIPGDWHKSANQMRVYRNAYDTADVDGQNGVSFKELDLVWIAMDPTNQLKHEDIQQLWVTLNPTGKESLSFADFLHGMRKCKDDPKCVDFIDISKPNKWELLSLLVDTPISTRDEEEILGKLAPVERAGIYWLKKETHPMNADEMRAVLERAADGQLRFLSDTQHTRMKGLREQCVLVCAFIGFVWTAFPAAVENFLVTMLEVDGVKDAYWVCHDHTIPNNVSMTAAASVSVNGTADQPGHEDTPYHVPSTDMDVDLFMCHITYDESSCGDIAGVPAMQAGAWSTMSTDSRCSYCQCVACQCLHHDDGQFDWSLENKLLWFWIYNFSSIIFFVVIEILLLMYFGVRYCVRVAWALDQRLVPLNTDRAFVADSLIRAAFELGNSTSITLGVDPQKEADSSSKFALLVRILMYKLKCIGTAAVLKQVVTNTTGPEIYTFAKPWVGTCLATTLWDGLIAHVIINQAELRGFGVYTSVEVFNEILDVFFPNGVDQPSSCGGVEFLSAFGKIQICRAVGAAIVKHGAMYPSMELLLRHAIQYLGLRGKRVVCEPGTLDNIQGFIIGLFPGSKREKDKGAHFMEFLGEDWEAIDHDGLSHDEVRVALCVHLLSFILDGDLSSSEMELWKAACHAAGPKVAVYDPSALKRLCVRYRGMSAISTSDLLNCFDPSVMRTEENQQVSWNVRMREFLHDVESCLAL
jgi:Ca2+-binding EF-hand superfamily protein